ncbi:MAG: hypothetical protein GKR89_00125 [Candidatus Latescibacteria bacterium]|nr:hypothetical protein [Candidatus Latescibacterota bacterium]
MTTQVPEWVIYPEEDWLPIAPAAAGLDEDQFGSFIAGLNVEGAAFGGEDHSNGRFGAVLTRGGYLLHQWGDRHYRHQTASTGKAFVRALVGFAAADGLLDPDEPVGRSWTGAGQLSHAHKHLDQGFHRRLTWRHLLGPRDEAVQYGGFPMELGIRWRQKCTGLEGADRVPGVPEWAQWSGDPFYDLYAHAEPGTVGLYSSAGFWRLGQALTHVWGRDLKDVLQERLFDLIGIPPQRWDWLSGGYIKEQKYLYPTIPDAYTYLDPPYEMGACPVRSGPGWVVISAGDLARFGHLNATDGQWKGIQIIDPEWLRGHGGGNKCGASGESGQYTGLGVVTATGIDYPHSLGTESFVPGEIFTGPVQKRGG